jgi:hypothetical protein
MSRAAALNALVGGFLAPLPPPPPRVVVPLRPQDIMPPTPDLQALVAQFGGYHRITLQAWAAYDLQMSVTWVWLAQRHVPKESRAKMKQQKATARKRRKVQNKSSENGDVDASVRDMRSGNA